MSIWVVLGVVCMAGGVGGLMNALLSDNGFLLPRTEEYVHGYIIRPGAIGTLISGAVAAGVSWGLYGPLSTALVLGPQVAVEGASLTLSSLVGAVLVGIGGARWLTNEVDKKLLRAAASGAAAGPPTPGTAQAMLAASPAQVLHLAKRLRSSKTDG